MIPKEVQDGLDVYATYYLALAHLERNNLDQAELMFKKTLELLPEPGPNQPYYNMFRRGANANLGRIYEAKKDPSPGHRPLHPARSDPAIRGKPAPRPRAGLARPMGAVPAATASGPGAQDGRRRPMTGSFVSGRTGRSRLPLLAVSGEARRALPPPRRGGSPAPRRRGR